MCAPNRMSRWVDDYWVNVLSLPHFSLFCSQFPAQSTLSGLRQWLTAPIAMLLISRKKIAHTRTESVQAAHVFQDYSWILWENAHQHQDANAKFSSNTENAEPKEPAQTKMLHSSSRNHAKLPASAETDLSDMAASAFQQTLAQNLKVFSQHLLFRDD